jgi:radical SAM protein with 4Fe4S-binding SPASM domain
MMKINNIDTVVLLKKAPAANAIKEMTQRVLAVLEEKLKKQNRIFNKLIIIVSSLKKCTNCLFITYCHMGCKFFLLPGDIAAGALALISPTYI